MSVNTPTRRTHGASGLADDLGPATSPRAPRMTWEALSAGFNGPGRFTDRFRGRSLIETRAGTRRFLVVSWPEHIDHVLHSARLNYVKSMEYEAIRNTAGLNLLTDEGDSWAMHRTTLNPAFARRRLNDLVDLMVAPIEEMAERLSSGGRVQLDIHEAMVQLTLEVVANSLFSQRFGDLVDRMHDLATTGLRYTEVLTRLTLVGLFGPRTWSALRWLTYTPLPMPPPLSTFRSGNRGLDDAVNAVIDARLANPSDDPDLLNRLIEADGGSWPRQRIRDEALTFILAGHETTANAMAWFWYLLALNPQARDRMFAEIDEVLDGRTPGADDLGSLPWTTACVQESQRFFSAVPLLARTAIDDDVIDGCRVRAGTTVLIQSHWVHHDPAHWSEPEVFDPRRFLPDSPRPHRSAYLPFGGGRRICIGQSFALMEMVLIAALFGQRVRLDLVPSHPVSQVQTLTLRPRRGIQVVASGR